MTTLQGGHDALSPSVLVVGLDRHSLSRTTHLLTLAGYRVKTATTFERAIARMARHTPDLLITDVRLGAYNGLHLVHRRHLSDPSLASIVTHTTADAALRPEASRAGAACLLDTQLDDALVSLAATVLDRAPAASRRRPVAASRRPTHAELAPSAI